MEVEGIVKSVTELGVFVRISKCRLPALAHPNNSREAESENLKDLFAVGDHVRAKVLKVDKEKKRISLGLKPSLFKSAEDGGDDSENENSDKEPTEDHDDDGDDEDEDEAKPEPMEVDEVSLFSQVRLGSLFSDAKKILDYWHL